MVDAYIALSQFARQKFVAGGLPSERLFVKPNFVDPDPGAGRGTGGYALYAGRLSREKGVATLAEAWRRLNHIPLRVAGDGPLRNAPWPAGVTTFGGLPHNSTLALLREAAMLVFPSTCYECCPMAILESLACGTPVIASNLGSIPEFVRHGYNGLLFRPGDPQDLARQVRWAFEHPEELRVMRANARREFEEKYTAERNYKMLMAIYEQAIENAHRRRAKKAAT
jgi:glycosyltransferase involved in cell wall biosynthesis